MGLGMGVVRNMCPLSKFHKILGGKIKHLKYALLFIFWDVSYLLPAMSLSYCLVYLMTNLLFSYTLSCHTYSRHMQVVFILLSVVMLLNYLGS